MKSQELIKIIKACGLANVEEVRFEGLHLKFKRDDTLGPRSDTDYVSPPSEQELKVEGDRAAEAADLSSLDDELQSLQIDDPSRFEDLLVQRELRFSGDANEEDYD